MTGKSKQILHKHLLLAVVEAIEKIFGENLYADKVIESQLRTHKKWGARDRHFVAETTYEVVRWWRYLWTVSQMKTSLDRANLLTICGVWLKLQRGIELPSWPEWNRPLIEEICQRAAKQRLNRAERESIPDWFDRVGSEELGELWEKVLPHLNEQAPVVLRTNRLKVTRDQLLLALKEEGIEASPAVDLEDGVILKGRANVFRLKIFHEGWFEVQDGASQQIAPLLGVGPGMRVIDGCAGAGGKSLHLAAIMENRGKLIALDINERKLEQLKIRKARAGVDMIECRWIDSTKKIKRLESSADALLLDVPCSGSGVLRRNPDSKWKLSRERFLELHKIQREILDSYCKMVRVGGKLVYATCSIFPSENGDQVRDFLKRNDSKWALEKELILFPEGAESYDGFYGALLHRLG